MRKYIKEKQLLLKLKHFKIPVMVLYDDDEWYEDYVTHRFNLPCHKSELEDIRFPFYNYNHWILDYDREKIEKFFK